MSAATGHPFAQLLGSVPDVLPTGVQTHHVIDGRRRPEGWVPEPADAGPELARANRRARNARDNRDPAKLDARQRRYLKNRVQILAAKKAKRDAAKAARLAAATPSPTP